MARSSGWKALQIGCLLILIYPCLLYASRIQSIDLHGSHVSMMEVLSKYFERSKPMLSLRVQLSSNTDPNVVYEHWL
jgi:hypothetical protein